MKSTSKTPSKRIGSGSARPILQPGGSGDDRRSPPLKNGFTLIEMVLVITVVGVLAGAAAVAFDPVLDSWVLGQSRGQMSDTLGVALNRMAQEISQLRDAQSLTIASDSDIQFTDVNNNVIRYRLNGSQLLRNADVMARNVQSLTFSYWDVNNAVLAAPTLSPAATNLWRLSIRVSGAMGGQTVTLESQVRPRNFRRS